MNHIVALSGGKDSTAMAIWLAENEPRDYQYIYTPTGEELPEMEAHWQRLGELLGKPLIALSAGVTLTDLIVRQEALPNARMRWCTRLLKIEPFIAYMVQNAPAIAYVGLRADESEEDRPGAIYGNIEGISQRYPLRELGWNIADVWNFIDERGIVIPQRSDCGNCFFQTLPEWYLLWKRHPERYARYEAQELYVTQKRGKPCTLRSDSRDTWPASLQGLRLEFESGRIPRNLANHLQLRLTSGDRDTMCRVCRL